MAVEGLSRRVTSSHVLVSIFLPLSSTHQAGPKANRRLPQLLILGKEENFLYSGSYQLGRA